MKKWIPIGLIILFTVGLAYAGTFTSYNDITSLQDTDEFLIYDASEGTGDQLANVTWGSIKTNLGYTSSILGVANGGTGASSLTDGGILLGSDTGAITALGVATNGQIPIGDGTTDPQLGTITPVANETDVTNAAGSITIGIVDPLIAGKGGTGAATLTDGGILLGSGTDPITAMGVLGDGYLAIGDNSTDPTTIQAFTAYNGYLRHEVGGLEGNVSSYSGLLAISGGAVSEVDEKSELQAQIQDVSDFAMADGDIYSGVHDFGSVTTFEIPNTSTGDSALTAQGMINFKADEDLIALHGGSSGEAQGEFGFSVLQHIVMVVDLSWYYDQESTYGALPIMTVGDDFPHGFTITQLSMRAVGGDPTTELTNVDLYCDTTPDFNIAADATKMDDLDTSAGVFSEDTTFVSATCANGAFMYIDIGDDPTDANVVWIFEMWGYAEED